MRGKMITRVVAMVITFAMAVTMAGCEEVTVEDKQNLDATNEMVEKYYKEKYGTSATVENNSYAKSVGNWGTEYDQTRMKFSMNDGTTVFYDVNKDTCYDNKQGKDIIEDLEKYYENQLEAYGLKLNENCYSKLSNSEINRVEFGEEDLEEMFNTYYDGNIENFLKNGDINLGNIGELYIKADAITGREYLDKIYELFTDRTNTTTCYYRAYVMTEDGFSKLLPSESTQVKAGDGNCIILDRVYYTSGKSKDKCLTREQ